MFQHTAARRRLRTLTSKSKTVKGVSTHSRPKAAAQLLRAFKTRRTSFNTQPPEGGCNRFVFFKITNCCFNTQPPEGGCLVMVTQDNNYNLVSTHSRPKAAALLRLRPSESLSSFNTQPPEGGCIATKQPYKLVTGFNTQPPEGGCR